MKRRKKAKEAAETTSLRFPIVKKYSYKTIIHPGEVNKIGELPQNMKIVVLDRPNVLIWDIDAQPDCNTDNAEFALDMCPTEPIVLSGGKDKSVVLWSIQDHISAAAVDQGSGEKASESLVEKAHNADLHCVDWNCHNVNLILTGVDDESEVIFCAITSGCMFVLRNLTADGVGTPIYKFDGHKAAVLCWCPDKASVYGSAAEDGILNVWDHEKVWVTVIAVLCAHNHLRDKVVDFHWNTSDPWTIVSVSDDCESSGGGGTLQIWRMSDLIYRPEEEVLEELEKFKSHILACSSKS
ncbi:hypothetical protein C5167_018231 [Papaver somniferum]|uniref:Uncharacterized protein n=1 Tax=Papaver somniferum TaxID=3469 RepID=A0A4Y7IQ07_PAPSO|nr:hypothetical protein C5167_018231 [Papaver somniferum]